MGEDDFLQQFGGDDCSLRIGDSGRLSPTRQVLLGSNEDEFVPFL